MFGSNVYVFLFEFKHVIFNSVISWPIPVDVISTKFWSKYSLVKRNIRKIANDLLQNAHF